jgi:hypothetical protein
MSVRSVRQVLIVALGLFSTSIAFARNPPALVKLQQASEHARQSGGGYRDINSRFGNVPARSPQLMSASGGYRDMNHRFPAAVN